MIATIFSSFVLLALGASAIPLTSRQTNTWNSKYPDRYDMCPPGFDQHRVHGACNSGFVGCAYASDYATCSGPERFVKSCGRPEYGQYYECPNNGFRGCTTDPTVCSMPGTDWVPEIPVPGVTRPELCPAGQLWQGPGACSSGYIGCMKPEDESNYCGGAPIPGVDSRRFWKTCGDYGKYRYCDNGFFGCAVEDICKIGGPVKAPAPPAPPKDTTLSIANEHCQTNTKYYAKGACTSGFVGCGTDAVCSGVKVWWGDCPAGTGTFYICAKTGFVGCTAKNPPPC